MKNHTHETHAEVENPKSRTHSGTAPRHVAEETIIAAGNHLAGAIDSARDTLASAQDPLLRGARSADRLVRDRPYHVIGAAFGLGAMMGFLWSRRSRN